MENSRRLVISSLRCLVIGAVLAAVIIPAAAWLLDRHDRQQAIRESKNQEAYALGSENPPSPESFYPQEVVPRPALVTGFVVAPAAEVTDQLRDEEHVLGVVVNGQARAWPLNVMTGPSREVFNDTLGGRGIAATW